MKILYVFMILASLVLPTAKSDFLVLVNKQNPCSEEYEAYVTQNLAPVFHTRKDGRPTQYMQAEAAYALDELLYAAEKAGYDITVTSAYRSRQYQAEIYDTRRAAYISGGHDESDADRLTGRYVALPGYSEHHTGLAVDMHSMRSADTAFADTAEFRWLSQNAPKYGYILRYPKGKEDITGYAFEPWHFRYVGKCAEEITRAGLTLEEYLSLQKNEKK